MSVFHAAHWLEANLSFGFHKSLVSTFQCRVSTTLHSSLLDVNVLTVAESSQYLTQR